MNQFLFYIKFALIFHSSEVAFGDVLSVRFDDRAIFNVQKFIKIGSIILIKWPKSLTRYLGGSTELSIFNATSGRLLIQKELYLSGGDSKKIRVPKRINLSDEHGRPLIINKWGKVGHATGIDPEAKPLLVESTHRIIQELTELGYNIAIGSATLIGAVRNGGKMLEDDDDSDLIVYVETDSPTEVNLHMLKLKHDLEKLGYFTIRHSGAHIQILFFGQTGEIKYYIDFFVGFFKDGYYNQPFNLRKKMPKEQIFPFSEIEWEGGIVPAPGSPKDWLVASYGEGWEIPNPAFRFETPAGTTYLFDAWFGNSLNIKRDFWEDWAENFVDNSPFDETNLHHQTLRKALALSNPILDIGFGSGLYTSKLAELGYTVMGIDFSAIGLKKAIQRKNALFASKTTPEELVSRVDPAKIEKIEKEAFRLKYNYVNLDDMNDTFDLVTDLAADSRIWNVNISHGLHQFIPSTRQNIYKIISDIFAANWAKQARGFAVISFDSELLSEGFDQKDPRTWLLTLEEFLAEIEDFNFFVQSKEVSTRKIDENRTREFHTVVITNRNR